MRKNIGLLEGDTRLYHVVVDSLSPNSAENEKWERQRNGPERKRFHLVNVTIVTI